MQFPHHTQCTEAPNSAPFTDWSQMGEREHFVQFYEQASYLMESLGGYVAAGIRAGDGCIVIATPEHRAELDRRLEQVGIDPGEARDRGLFFSLDAAETLSRFMSGSAPDADLFRGTIEPVLKAARGDGRRVRAFGEMVALLWQEGQGEAAIRLEALWNDLGRSWPFALFCAYPIADFDEAADGASFQHICCEHSRVIPAESYGRLQEPEGRLRTISLLQQKAVALHREAEERRHAETSLRDQQAQLALAVEVASLGVFQVSRSAGTVAGSPLFFSHLGVAFPGSLPPEAVLQRIHPEDRTSLEQALFSPSSTESLFRMECRLLEAGSSVRWLEISATPMSQEAVRFIGTTREITERKKREADQQFLAEFGEIIRPVRNSREVVTMAARAVRRHLLADRCFFAGLSLGESPHPAPADSQAGACWCPEFPDPALLKVLGAGAMVHVADPERDPRVSSDRLPAYRHWELQNFAAVPLLKHQELAGVLVVSSAQGERTWGAEEVHLLKEVLERTWMAVQNARLYEQAQRARVDAEQALKSRDHFISILSHELRTPLTPAVMSISSVLRRGDLAPEVRKSLDRAYQNILLESRLIDDLLDVNRFAKRSVQLQLEDLDLHELLHAVVQICQAELSNRTLSVQLALLARPALLRGDPTHLQQAFWNLLKNAIKFSPLNSTITIRTRREADRLVVEFEDRGIGIAPEALRKIFHPFEQADDSIMARFGGLGLGLAICKSVVEAHGGSIEAESHGAGLGALFRVALPAL